VPKKNAVGKEDVAYIIARWRLNFGSDLVRNEAEMPLLLEDCRQVADGATLRKWFDAWVREQVPSQYDRPTWSAFLRAMRMRLASIRNAALLEEVRQRKEKE